MYIYSSTQHEFIGRQCENFPVSACVHVGGRLQELSPLQWTLLLLHLSPPDCQNRCLWTQTNSRTCWRRRWESWRGLLSPWRSLRHLAATNGKASKAAPQRCHRVAAGRRVRGQVCASPDPEVSWTPHSRLRRENFGLQCEWEGEIWGRFAARTPCRMSNTGKSSAVRWNGMILKK